MKWLKPHEVEVAGWYWFQAEDRNDTILIGLELTQGPSGEEYFCCIKSWDMECGWAFDKNNPEDIFEVAAGDRFSLIEKPTRKE